MTSREASHAGSWYTSRSSTLSAELDSWLSRVPSSINGEQLPIPGARIIIAPHAGYSYSGAAAAWAYKSLDLSKAKRVFLLGPSHHYALSGCALSKHSKYATPLGDLVVDRETVEGLHGAGAFERMSTATDEDEHSLEMHLPYIYKMLTLTFRSDDEYPTLIPIMVGNTSVEREKSYGRLLAPYLVDPTSVFVISSDFCHWGLRFQYTYYVPEGAESGYHLRRKDKAPEEPVIHESIARVDGMAMDAVESGEHSRFLANLHETGNTVCGRHPIGVVMAALEVLRAEGRLEEGKGRFSFVRYERSSDVENVLDSSVSYASAYAVL